MNQVVQTTDSLLLIKNWIRFIVYKQEKTNTVANVLSRQDSPSTSHLFLLMVPTFDFFRYHIH